MRFDRRAAAAVAVALVLALVIWWVAASAGTRRGATTPQLAAATTQLADDFSSGAGWTASPSSSSGFSYERATYVLRLERPGDDALSVLALPGSGWRSVAATAAVNEAAPAGGLVGVGCATGNDQAYVGAVDPAGSGFAILRATRSGLTLLRAGAEGAGVIRGVNQTNELQVQCLQGAGRAPVTSIRLFAGGRLLGTAEDRPGWGPFRGIALGGISLRRPLNAMFIGASLQSLPPSRTSAVATACERVAASGSLENDYAWLVDSGATRAETPDLDRREVERVGRELVRLSASLRGDAGAAGVDSTARGALRDLATRLRMQAESLRTHAAGDEGSRIDLSGANDALSCPARRYFDPPDLAGQRPTGVPARAAPSQLIGLSRSLDAELAHDLPAPDFAVDTTLPVQPDQGVRVDLRYNSFRVFGGSLVELNRSLRVRAVHVESELAEGVTSSRFEVTYDPQPGPNGAGCTLQPQVGLSLLVTLPDWEPPVGADRYVRNQWNQFMWDLDDHERHHATLWIEAANRMAADIEQTPSGVRCQDTVTAAKARADHVFKRYDRLQRRYDADVAGGRLPRPSLP